MQRLPGERGGELAGQVRTAFDDLRKKADGFLPSASGHSTNLDPQVLACFRKGLDGFSSLLNHQLQGHAFAVGGRQLSLTRR
jgi:hypothetical protein